MIALVTTVLLPGLFAATGLFATVVLLGTWRTYGGAFARLQAELTACDSVPVVAEQRLQLDHRVGMGPGSAVVQPASVSVLRPVVSPVRRPAPLCALPVAA